MTATSDRRGILVVGSINYDILLFQERLPRRGETLLASELREEFGGKGANQAVQCARLGQRVCFVGAVGKDQRGAASLKNLEAEGVECHVAQVENPTGVGVVHVLDNGEVHATILAGANGDVTPGLLAASTDLFERAAYVILQNEIPMESVIATIRLAVAAGSQVVYNAAPARFIDAEISRLCHWLVLNEDEAMSFLGERVEGVDAMRRAVPALWRFCDKVIVTLGADGSLVATDGEVHHIPAVAVQAVDTTGAGDSYVAAFVSALNDKAPPLEAARFAGEVAAVATTGVGAQRSMPGRGDVAHDPVRTSALDPGSASRG